MCGLPVTLLGRWSLFAGGSSGCGGPYGFEVIDGRAWGALPKLESDGEVAVGEARGLP
jgi:hypothetical protein